MIDLVTRRQFFADEIQMCANVRTPALVEAFAAVPREAFLPPGPWTIRGEGDSYGASRVTPDANPRHVQHNVSVAIDAARQLFNGAPTAVVPAIDALGLTPGSRVLHIGCGLGYYTAVIAHVVGPQGQVAGVEVDDDLAVRAARNLASIGWVTVERGNGAEPVSAPVDAILMHAGVTHPLDTWLDALAPGGRLVCPITAAIAQMGPVSKGFMFLITKRADDRFDAQPLSLTVIYTAVGVRDDSLNPIIGAAMMTGMRPRVTRLRRDPHTQESACWLHGPRFCFAQ